MPAPCHRSYRKRCEPSAGCESPPHGLKKPQKGTIAKCIKRDFAFLHPVQFVLFVPLCFLWLTFHFEGLHQEGPAICDLFDELRGRFAGAVAGLGFDANQDRSITGLRRLQRCGKLETVSRPDAIVMIRGGDHRRRIRRSRLDVVQR